MMKLSVVVATIMVALVVLFGIPQPARAGCATNSLLNIIWQESWSSLDTRPLVTCS